MGPDQARAHRLREAARGAPSVSDDDAAAPLGRKSRPLAQDIHLLQRARDGLVRPVRLQIPQRAELEILRAADRARRDDPDAGAPRRAPTEVKPLLRVLALPLLPGAPFLELLALLVRVS